VDGKYIQNRSRLVYEDSSSSCMAWLPLFAPSKFSLTDQIGGFDHIFGEGLAFLLGSSRVIGLGLNCQP
jgi:hypothetical protein